MWLAADAPVRRVKTRRAFQESIGKGMEGDSSSRE